VQSFIADEFLFHKFFLQNKKCALHLPLNLNYSEVLMYGILSAGHSLHVQVGHNKKTPNETLSGRHAVSGIPQFHLTHFNVHRSSL
jgi:hypothetical protein